MTKEVRGSSNFGATGSNIFFRAFLIKIHIVVTKQNFPFCILVYVDIYMYIYNIVHIIGLQTAVRGHICKLRT
jgi:hypothetical protein